MLDSAIKHFSAALVLSCAIGAQSNDGTVGTSPKAAVQTPSSVKIQAAPRNNAPILINAQANQDGSFGVIPRVQLPKLNADGTRGKVTVIGGAGGQNQPTGPNGIVGGGQIGKPMEDAAVSLNPAGGTIQPTSWAAAWFAHRVVAPKDLNITSFDFFGITTASVSIATRIYSHSTTTGKPATVLRNSKMSVTTRPGFRRSLVSSLAVKKGTIFYIAYRVASGYNPRLTAGVKGTYYWGTTAPTSGPFSPYPFAWKVNTFTPGSYNEYGWSCEGLGAGTGQYAGGVNTDATNAGATSWVTNAQFMHRIVAQRDMYVSGAEFLAKMTTGAASVTTYMYLSTAGKPGTLVRSGTMIVRSGAARWCNTCWEPLAVKRGTVFFVGYKTIGNLRIDTTDGDLTPYYWKSSTATAWGGPFTIRKFGVRIDSQPCGGENVFATTNATTGFVTNRQFIHRYVATSDMWLGGFSFRAGMASGSQTIPTYVYRAVASTGKPATAPVRTGSMTVGTGSAWRPTSFSPVFLAKGEIFYVGYRTPSASGFRIEASGGASVNTTYYWNGPPSWSGPWSTRKFGFRLDCHMAATNAKSTVAGATGWATNAQFAHRIVAPRDMWITGFSFLSRMTTGAATLTTYLYRDTAGKPGSLVRSGRMVVRTSTQHNATCFEPYFVKKGTPFHCVYRTPANSNLRIDTTQGANTAYNWKSSTATSWSGPWTSRKFSLKVHGYGASCGYLTHNGVPEIGKTMQIKLVGAKPSAIYGLFLGTTKTAIPFGGCHLWTNYLVSLTSGSTGSGNVTVNFGIPNVPAFIGISFYNQFFVFESLSPFKICFTNGGAGKIGG